MTLHYPFLGGVSMRENAEVMGLIGAMLSPLMSKGLRAGLPLMQVKDPTRLWAEYALTHFNGRLMPSCCHRGCSILNGVSEAALPTRLCGGCRRVRYCSDRCREEAWYDWGHGLVCGRGEWAPT